MIRHICALAALAALSLTAVACTAEADDEAIEVEETNQDLVSRSAYFETFQGLDGKYYFNVMAGNGENVLRSQGYTTLASAEKGVASVLANGAWKANFEIKQAHSGDYYFVVKAANHEVIGTSELFASKYNAERGARTVRALVRIAKAPSEIKAAPQVVRFELFAGEDGQTYFRLRAANGEILLGSEGYASASNARRAIDAVLANGQDTSSFRVFPAWDGGFSVRLVAGNGHVIARGESYASESNANRAVERMADILRSGPSITE